jgi:hypothetical protein
MKSVSVPTCLAAVLLLTGCARMKVSCESEPTYNFAQIQTYQWIDPPQDILEQDDTYLNKDLQQALNNELAVRGWDQVLEAGGATIQVTYYVKIMEHEEYVESTSRSESEFAGGLVYNKDGWNYEERGPDQLVYTVETGTLQMTVTDTASGNRVWRGTLQTKLDRSALIEKKRELFQLAAHKLLEQLPSGSK